MLINFLLFLCHPENIKIASIQASDSPLSKEKEQSLWPSQVMWDGLLVSNDHVAKGCARARVCVCVCVCVSEKDER